MVPPPPRSTLFPYTTLFRSSHSMAAAMPNTVHRSLNRPTTPVLKSSFRVSTSLTIRVMRSEEHTSELQSRLHLVCRLLLEKKKESATWPALAGAEAPAQVVS